MLLARLECRGRRWYNPCVGIILRSVGVTGMQYTIRGVPDYVDTEVRAYAQRESKSLNQVLLDALKEVRS